MLIFGVLVSLAVGGDVALAEGSTRPTGTCAAAAVSAPGRPNGRTTYSARKVVDLELAVRPRGRLVGAHTVHFKVYTPNGYLYQDLSARFDVEDATAGARPRQPRRLRVGVRLPVGGTSITTNSLYGKWRVVPFLDDETRPCASATVFRIAP
jgi:hypothetical protein